MSPSSFFIIFQDFPRILEILEGIQARAPRLTKDLGTPEELENLPTEKILNKLQSATRTFDELSRDNLDIVILTLLAQRLYTGREIIGFNGNNPDASVLNFIKALYKIQTMAATIISPELTTPEAIARQKQIHDLAALDALERANRHDN